MRFALLGDHPDGLAMARALVASGRHELVLYSGQPVAGEYLRRWNIAARSVGDVEEILADPAVDAVIVAGKPAERPAQLRRALQSERHVLCVHPADASPDLAYEASMIQADTGVLLMPLLHEALHPALVRLADLLRASASPLELIEMDRSNTESVLLETGTPGHAPGLPGWDSLRLLAGEIVEIVGLAGEEDIDPGSALLLAGRCGRGGLFQLTLLPDQAEARCRWYVRTGHERVELLFPNGYPGPAQLSWRDSSGQLQQETWDSIDPWAALVSAWEKALDTGNPVKPTWQDEIRCLELDDAARRSVERRRASTLEYQDVSEEVGFKGTMTLAGCALLWASIVLLIVSVWVPWLGWVILPAIGLFLVLQLLRWALPPRSDQPPKPGK
jgi:predicted dehydrogenase